MINLPILLFIALSGSPTLVAKSETSEAVEMAGYYVPELRLSQYQTYFCTTESKSKRSKVLIDNKLHTISLAKGIKMKRNSPKVKYITIGTYFCGYVEN